VGALPNAVRKGYKFLGWYTKKSGGKKITKSTKIKKNTTYYAHWKKLAVSPPKPPKEEEAPLYTLTLDPNGGKVLPTFKKLKAGAWYGTLPTPVRENYNFTGWFSAQSGGAPVGDSSVMGNANTTIYAQWEQKDPVIEFSDRNPVKEYLYENGFFYGTRVNFNLVVIDAAGLTEIKIYESAGRTKNGIAKYIYRTRTIPINGPGTYPLSQEMWNAYAGYADQSTFYYEASAYGKDYFTDYTGCYNAYNGAWEHYFGL
jgi:uncharacterized repeat protein (TIGR02543 family)